MKAENDSDVSTMTASKIHTDQIDKLTAKLLDYKKRLRNFERAEEKTKAETSSLQQTLTEAQYALTLLGKNLLIEKWYSKS